jgi:hypothetical protein
MRGVMVNGPDFNFKSQRENGVGEDGCHMGRHLG